MDWRNLKRHTLAVAFAEVNNTATESLETHEWINWSGTDLFLIDPGCFTGFQETSPGRTCHSKPLTGKFFIFKQLNRLISGTHRIVQRDYCASLQARFLH